MVRSMIQFFEVTRSDNGFQNNVLYEQMCSKFYIFVCRYIIFPSSIRVYINFYFLCFVFFLSDLYVLLHLALQLTDLLLAQLVMTRRELESNQYGAFTSDLPNGEDTRRDNSADNNLTRENNRASESASRQSTDRERSPRSLLEISNMSGASNVSLDGRDWSDVHSVTESRRQRLMAMHLKRLSRHRRGSASTSSENRGGANPTASRSNINGDNSSDNIQNEDNRQSISENALSAEVQSIVERIQNSGSIDNDNRGGDVRTRLIGQHENRTADTTQNPRESRNANEGYMRRIYRNTTLSEPTMRRSNESRSTQEDDDGEFVGWRPRVSEALEERHRLLRRIRNARCNKFARGSSSSHDQHYNFNDRRSTQDRESHRRQFNVPELQVNSMPVNDSQFDNSALNSRRRQNAPPSPPHTPPPYLINSSAYYNDNRNNDHTNESTMNDQPGPSWIEVPNRHRVYRMNF